jgi:hypothetical protein
MSFINQLATRLKKTSFIFKLMYNFFKYKILSDYCFVKFSYFEIFRQNINLKNPKSLNEKINWLKLYDRSDLHTLCADKIQVRDYVKEKIGSSHLITLVNNNISLNELVPENFPNTPFILKTNHNSGGTYIVLNKDESNWEEIHVFFKKQLKLNHYTKTKEWQYKGITPKIFAEKLLLNSDGKIPSDYKFHCFKGKVQFIQLDINRETENHYRYYYDSSWNLLPFKWFPNDWQKLSYGIKYSPVKNPLISIDKPNQLSKMITISEKLSDVFSYSRIDLYELNNRVYFGEITFHHDSGLIPILPKHWDYKLGKLLDLN